MKLYILHMRKRGHGHIYFTQFEESKIIVIHWTWNLMIWVWCLRETIFNYFMCTYEIVFFYLELNKIVDWKLWFHSTYHIGLRIQRLAFKCWKDLWLHICKHHHLSTKEEFLSRFKRVHICKNIYHLRPMLYE